MVSVQRIAMVCLVALAALLALASTPVSARSSGLLGYCDLSPQPGWPMGKFGRNMTSGVDSGVMRWVTAPVSANFYTIRSGDGASVSSDPKTYIPGGTWNELHLRVLNLQRRYIGLVMYATNKNVNITGLNYRKDVMVGNWTFPPHVPFQTPDSCNRQAVTHSDANLKPLHTRFYFSAPVGSGKLTFRVLIKQGEQNKGSFFWPETILTLTEGVAPTVPEIPPQDPNATTPDLGPPASQVVLGNAGTACADVCFKQSPATPYCDSDSTKNIRNVSALQAAVKGRVQCIMPMIAGCPYAGAARLTADGFCSFRPDDTNLAACPASLQNVTLPEPDVCFTEAASTAQPICVCTNVKAAQPVNPYAAATGGGPSGGTQGTINSASKSSVNFILLALASLAAMFTYNSNKQQISCMSVAALAMLFFASPASAHNYIKSLHRANEAAVAVPCQARVGTQPHAQLIAGQEFEIEWSMGHGDYTEGPFYFAIVHENDYDQLRRDNLTAIFKDYIAKAPATAVLQTPSTAYWEKHHIKNQNEISTYDDTYFVEAALPLTDPTYINRDAVYMQLAHPSQYKNNKTIVQTRFKPELLTKDARVSYKSDLYPWLEQVNSFTNPFKEHTTYSNQASIARFIVPAFHGTGNYVVFFYWSGYKDCMDINIVAGATPVAKRYGSAPTPSTPATVIKQDHCEYTYVGSAMTQCRKVGPSMDVSQCIKDCQSKNLNGIQCTGVQVVRAKNPARALSYTPNIPFITQFSNQTLTDMGIYQPCALLSVHDRTVNNCVRPYTSVCNPNTLNLTDTDYVCYGLKPLRNQDNQVEEDYRISNEPEDPIFYSTCYQMVQDGGFVGIANPTYTAPDWNTGDACLSCDFHANLNNLNTSQVVNWMTGLANTCSDCDLMNSKIAATDAAVMLAGKNLAAAGVPTAAANVAPSGTSGTASVDDNGLLTGSSSKGFFDNKLNMGLVIGFSALVGLALVFLAFYVLSRVCVTKSVAMTDLSRMQVENTTWNSTELTQNPALGTFPTQQS